MWVTYYNLVPSQGTFSCFVSKVGPQNITNKKSTTPFVPYSQIPLSQTQSLKQLT